MRKTIIFLLLISTLMFMTQPIYAALPDENELQHETVMSATVTLSITSTGFATVKIHVAGKTSLYKISATSYIEKKVGTRWVRVSIGTTNNAWKDSSTSQIFNKTHYTSLSGSGEYRATTVFTLTGTNTTETITVTSTKTY